MYMLEKYLKLLDTFKEEKFSLVVGEIKQRILTALNSNKFSGKMQQYLSSMQAEEEPFINFSQQPAQISQIKKIINSLYHAEMALKELEGVNIRSGNRRTADLALLYFSSMKHVYKASFTITHLDIDFAEVFHNEIAALSPLLALFDRYIGNHKEDTALLLRQMQDHQLSHKIGLISGIVVDQLQPQSGMADYEFLTQFSAVIPSYLDQLSGYIQQFSAQVSAEGSHPDPKQLEDLQHHALLLLTSINTLKRDDFFFSIRLLNYARIIQHTIKLSMSIMDQIGHVSDSSQDVIRDRLSELKYQQLPQLFGFLDKFEEDAMLKPGTLSGPLMSKLKGFYQTLVNCTRKIVDFSKKGEDLLTIEDARFVTLRQDKAYERAADYSQKIVRLKDAQKTAQIFFRLLKNPQFTHKRILNLSTFNKDTLTTHYKFLHPYISKIDRLTSGAIVDALTRSGGWGDSLSLRHKDSVSTILALESKLNLLFEKEMASNQFHKELTVDTIDSLHKRLSDLSFVPCKAEESVFILDESNVLGAGPLVYECYMNGDRLLANTKSIFSANEFMLDQHALLLKYHEMNRMKLANAQKAYQDFSTILNKPNSCPLLKDFDETTRKKLLNLYRVFQPHLVSILAPHPNLHRIDRAIITALTDQKTTISVTSIKALDMGVRSQFELAMLNIQNRSNDLAARYKKILQTNLQQHAFVSDQDASPRHNYVIKHTRFSQAAAYMRRSLYQLTGMLNHTLRSRLRPDQDGLPFSEIDEIGTDFEPTNQVLMLKKFFNCLYHLEQLAVELEKLQDQSMESVYVNRILQATFHLREAFYLVRALSKDTYLSLIARDLMQKLQDSQATLLEITPYYKPESGVDVPSVNTGMVYALNALMILPEHVQAIQGAPMLSSLEIRAIHQHTKVVAANIQRVIDRSNSYFKLFFETPTMYRLFKELKEKLVVLSTTSHDAVTANLATIKNDILNKILVETDLWEDKLGFSPGLLSGPMKDVLDEYYKGLLEPLGLSSHTHLKLVTSDVPIEQRIEAVNQRIQQAINERNSLEVKQVALKRLLDHIYDYKGLSSLSGVSEHMQLVLKRDFHEALPILKREKGQFNFEDRPLINSNKGLDDLLNGDAVGDSVIKDIEGLSSACLKKYKALSTNQQLLIDTCKEKTSYLMQLKSEKIDLDTQFVDKYTRTHYKRQVVAILAKQFGLIHCDAEYKQKLKLFLEENQSRIIAEAKNTQNIKTKIEELLLTSMTQFEKTNYAAYYQLEAIKISIEQLKIYIHQSNIAIQKKESLFESSSTLSNKTKWVNKLDSVNDQSLPVHRRIENIKNTVGLPSFKTALLSYHDYDRFTYRWLKQSIVSLLELLRLYTPEREKCYQQLEISIKEPREIGQLSARFGLFSKPGEVNKLPAVESSAQILLGSGIS